MRPKPYVGRTSAGEYRVFRSDVTPTEETHPDYTIAIGPFETVRGAHCWSALANAGSPAALTQEGAEAEARRIGRGIGYTPACRECCALRPMHQPSCRFNVGGKRGGV